MAGIEVAGGCSGLEGPPRFTHIFGTLAGMAGRLSSAGT